MPFDPKRLAAAKSATTVAGFDAAKLEAAKSTPGLGERIRSGTESFLRTSALPAIAGTAAGISTSGGAPIVGVPSAALAGAAGEAARQIGLRAVRKAPFFEQGDPNVPETSMQAAGEILKRGAEQGGAELIGRGIGAAAHALAPAATKVGGAAMQGLTKIPAASFERIFDNPAELLTAPLKSTINKAYGKVGFLAEEGIEEAAKAATTSNSKFMLRGIRELNRPFNEVNPKVLLDARKAIDAEIDVVRFAGGPKANRSVIKAKEVRLDKMRQAINKGLDILAGKGPVKAFSGVNADALALREADALATSGAAANNFRSFIPRVNVMQSTPRALTAPFVVPAVAGGITALAGAAAKAAPYVGRAAMGGMAGGAQLSEALLEAMRRSKRKKS